MDSSIVQLLIGQRIFKPNAYGKGVGDIHKYSAISTIGEVLDSGFSADLLEWKDYKIGKKENMDYQYVL